MTDVYDDDDAFGARFLEDYFAECEEYLTLARRSLLALEDGADSAAVSDLFRSFHTLKGISGMVGVHDAEELAHELETYLTRAAAEPETLRAALDPIAEGLALFDGIVAATREDKEIPSAFAFLERLGTLERASSGITPSPPLVIPRLIPSGESVWRFVFKPSRALAADGINVGVVRARLQALGRMIEAKPLAEPEGVAFEFLVALADEAEAAAALGPGVKGSRVASERPRPAARAGADAPAAAAAHVVRVDLARLDELMQMVGELVIIRARQADTLQRLASEAPTASARALQENNLAMERQLRDLREGIMRVRLVPIGEVFERMRFAVRDIARGDGKSVTVRIEGQQTEIDKYLVERMMEPLLHLVRNAVSHGVELPAERRAAGKQAEATVTLRASTAGERIFIEVEDDGRGIDRARVTARASANGLIASDAEPAAADLLDILCAEGFSTRDEADRASGRGVGMAVVRSTIAELGGSMRLATSPGAGSRFTIELPLTLAIADALVVSCGGQTFAIPQTSVREVLEVSPDRLTSFDGAELLTYRGGVLPIVRLADHFRLGHAGDRSMHVLVLASAGVLVGLGVDRVLGQREVVVRPITDPLAQVPGVAGATELGDGRAILILDAAGLGRLAPPAAA